MTPNTATITSKMVCAVIGRNAEHAGTPEGKLWLAVILGAISDLEGIKSKSGEGKINKLSAIVFFKTKGFDQICDFAGLQADAVREAVARIGTTVQLKHEGIAA